VPDPRRFTVVARLAALLAAFRQRPPWSRALVGLTVVSVLGGLALRSRGYLFDRHGLWFDEALWVDMLLKLPLTQHVIRPIGFMTVSKGLSLLLGPSEAVLRGMSWVASIVTLLISPSLARRLYATPAARCLFVAIVALHPALIDLAKEFKPYSVSILFHMGLLLLTLRSVATRSLRDLSLTLLVANIGIFFAQDLIFALPGAFLVLGWELYRHDRRRLPLLFGAALTIISVLLLQYFFIWRRLDTGEAEYWGDKYSVFYTPKEQASLFSWWLERARGVGALPGMRRDLWEVSSLGHKGLEQMRNVDRVVWEVVHVVGLAALAFRRSGRLATLLVLPLAVQWVFNALGFWPAGAFRTNTFLIGYTAAIAGAALDWRDARSASWAALAPTCVLVIAPLLLFDHNFNDRKKVFCHDGDYPALFRELMGVEPIPGGDERTSLLVDERSCALVTYYTQYQPKMARRSARRFHVECVPAERMTAAIERATPVPPGHAWLISDLTGPHASRLRASVPDVQFHWQFRADNHQLFELVRPLPP
jgi:hypothetical protein